MNDKVYNFYITHELTEYAGKWVAVVEDEVVASGDNARLVLEQTRKNRPGSEPALAKVPKGEILAPALSALSEYRLTVPSPVV
jgi:hypothetical protein